MSSHQWRSANGYIARFGSFGFENVPNLLVYDDEPWISLVRSVTTGYLGIDAKVYDPFGKYLAGVKHNNIYPVEGREQECNNNGSSADRFVLNLTSFNVPLIDIRIREEAVPAEIEVSAYVFLPNGMWLNFSPNQLMTSTHWIFKEGFAIKDAEYGFKVKKDQTIQIPNLHT